MVILNDWGLGLEILGFIIFLFIPITETYNIRMNAAKENRITKCLNKKSPRTRDFIRYLGIGLIMSGLLMQSNYLNNLS